MMRTLVESFKRLYKSEKITKDDVVQRMEKRLITQQEAEYILSEEFQKRKKQK